MNSQTEQIHSELEVFRRFSKHYPEQLDIDTLRKMPDPCPDLQCGVLGGGCVAFEVAELVHQGMARNFYSGVDLKQRLDSYYAGLSAGEKQRFDRLFWGNLLYVTFQPNTSKIQRERSIPTIFDTLSRLKEIGEQHVPENPALKKTVSVIHFNRIGESKPCFDVEGGGFASDPLLETVMTKFQKSYTSEYPTELLVYYGLMPTEIGVHTRQDAYDCIKRDMGQSSFRRVWIYSWHEDRVLSLIKCEEA